MFDSLEKLRTPASAHPADGVPGTRITPIPALTDEEECETPSYGFLRGIRDRALNIEFRRTAEGDEVSFPYAWLGPTRHHPSLGILMLFAGSEHYLVVLKGRNLNAVNSGMNLYDRGLLRHRVTWIREATREESRSLPETVCIIEKIEISVVTEEEASRLLALGEVK